VVLDGFDRMAAYNSVYFWNTFLDFFKIPS